MNQKIQIKETKFGTECNQEWDAMRIVSQCKHCDLCNKPVLDFTSWTRDEIIAFLSQNPQTCGRYTLEHVQPGMVPIAGYMGKARAVLAALLTALGIESVNAQTPENHLKKHPIHFRDTCARPRSDSQMETQVADSSSTDNAVTPPPPKPVPYYRPRRRLYFSSDFPFIHWRRHYVMGRFAVR